MPSKKSIFAIGGGKGGVGKSVLCTNLAIGLALSGQRVVLVDMDFGASNLHVLLGISRPRYGFLDLYHYPKDDLTPLLLNTGVSNLKFLSAAGDHTGSANLSPEFSATLLNNIQNLEADAVLLDLGPGTNFNTLKHFNFGDQGIVVTTPDMPSVMNGFSFIKGVLFQRLQEAFQDHPDILSRVDHSAPPDPSQEVFSIEQLRESIRNANPELEEILNTVLTSADLGLVVNRVRRKKDLRAGENLAQLVKKYLEVDLRFLGYIVESDRVRESVNEMVPFLIRDPQSKPSENLQGILSALIQSDIRLEKKGGIIVVSKQIPLSSSWNH